MSESSPLPINAGSEGLRWTHALADGRQVAIRPLRQEDAAAERRFIEGLSPASRRNRFLSQMASPSDELIKRLTDIDQVDDVALAAVIEENHQDRIIGVSRYATGTARNQCECAVVVADDWQHKGLGTALMRHLIETARQRGLQTMQSFDLGENTRIRDLARSLGFECRTDPDDVHQVIYTLPLDPARTST